MVLLLRILVLGSPPRMRGKLLSGAGTSKVHRITPAYAGKTLLLHLPLYQHEDHPRVCGENSISNSISHVLSGSPPRMRGKRNSKSVRCRSAGITPAYAGKTYGGFLNAAKNKDHPRVCGENAARRWLVAVNMGSPPRMRGKRKHERK